MDECNAHKSQILRASGVNPIPGGVAAADASWLSVCGQHWEQRSGSWPGSKSSSQLLLDCRQWSHSGTELHPL